MKDKPLLIRFRARDSREGVTRATMKKIAGALDITETEAVHRALVEYARRLVPRYAADAGPITDAQHARIAGAVRRKHGRAKVVGSLFDGETASTRTCASKRVSSSRTR